LTPAADRGYARPDGLEVDPAAGRGGRGPARAGAGVRLDALDAAPDDRMTFEAANDDPTTGGSLSYFTACVVR
jgi:hypothetical protein